MTDSSLVQAQLTRLPTVVELGFDPDALREKYRVERDKRLRADGVARIRSIEKAADAGGTWYWNRYPGAACDSEAYIYLPLCEELGSVPTHKYAFAPKILEHARKIARHFRLYDDICLQTQVKGMQWDETSQRWCIRTDRVQSAVAVAAQV